MLETEYFRRAEQNEMTIRHKQSQPLTNVWEGWMGSEANETKRFAIQSNDS